MPRSVGRPPKPIEEKRRLGNPGKRSLPEPGTLTVLHGAGEPPDPPRPLGTQGREAWNRIWDAVTFLAEKIDLDKVLLLCERVDERHMLRQLVQADTMASIRQASSTGEPPMPTRLWRERNQLRAIEEQIDGALSDLGMDPVSRARLGVAEVKPPPSSTLDRIAARRASRG